MEKINVPIVLESGSECPVYATPLSAGADVRCRESFTLRPGERRLVYTGIKMSLPDGYECQVRPRSGLAVKHGITVLNSPGTIDADYRGECCVLLMNTNLRESYTFAEGERVAQFVVTPVVQAKWDLVLELDSTERGEGGFGSTGRR